MEDLQTRGKVVCCNSKLDFIQPFKTHLQVNTGNKNIAPGKVETRKVNFNKEDRQNKTKFRQEDRQKRKTPDNKEDRLESQMKRQKLDDLDDSRQFRQNVKRSSTPVADFRDEPPLRVNINSRRKRTSEEAELSSAESDLDNGHCRKRKESKPIINPVISTVD